MPVDHSGLIWPINRTFHARFHFFSCFSRKQVLGPRYKEECAAAFARLPPGLPKLGFYTFGELSPYDGATTHHESTFTVALAKLWS